jgi:hypothetical protein
MRTLVFALLLLTAAPATRAAQPAPDTAPKIPHMSRQEALAYLDKEQLAVEPSNLVNPLLSGDAETVEALLSAGVGANDMTDMPKPALRLAMSACAHKELEPAKILTVIEVLLAHDAKVNETAPSELSPLMVAAQHGLHRRQPRRRRSPDRRWRAPQPRSRGQAPQGPSGRRTPGGAGEKSEQVGKPPPEARGDEGRVIASRARPSTPPGH